MQVHNLRIQKKNAKYIHSVHFTGGFEGMFIHTCSAEAIVEAILFWVTLQMGWRKDMHFAGVSCKENALISVSSLSQHEYVLTHQLAV